MFRIRRIRRCNPVWVRKLADVVTSLWLGIIVLSKELFNVISVSENYSTISIWNKWKCERENQSLDSYLPEDYYDLNYNGRTKLSIFLIHYIGAQSDLTQVTTLKNKNLKLSLWAKSEGELWIMVNCENWQTVCRTVYVISWTVALILSSRKIVHLEHVFVSFQDFVGKTRNFSVWSLARFGREEGYT